MKNAGGRQHSSLGFIYGVFGRVPTAVGVTACWRAELFEGRASGDRPANGDK
jgi:hypothetical protein